MPFITTQGTLSLFLLALCTLADNSNFLNPATSPIHSPDDGALNANLLGSSWTTDQGKNDPLQPISNQQVNPNLFLADQPDNCKNHQPQTRKRRQMRFKREPDTLCRVEESGGTQTTTEPGEQPAPITNESSKERPITEPNNEVAVPGTSAGTPNSGICGHDKVQIPLCFLPTSGEASRLLAILITPCRARK